MLFQGNGHVQTVSSTVLTKSITQRPGVMEPLAGGCQDNKTCLNIGHCKDLESWNPLLGDAKIRKHALILDIAKTWSHGTPC